MQPRKNTSEKTRRSTENDAGLGVLKPSLDIKMPRKTVKKSWEVATESKENPHWPIPQEGKFLNDEQSWIYKWV